MSSGRSSLDRRERYEILVEFLEGLTLQELEKVYMDMRTENYKRLVADAIQRKRERRIKV